MTLAAVAHLLFHATHLNDFGVADAVTQTATLVLVLVLVLALPAVAVRALRQPAEPKR